MANPFRVPGDEPEQDNDNPFALPAPVQLIQRTDADVLQEDSEMRLDGDIREQLGESPPSADTEREWAQAGLGEDLPTPQSYPEALAAATKRHGTEYRPNPDSSDDIERLADRLSYLHLTRSGMIDDNGPIAGITEELVGRVRGAYLNNLTVLYSDITPEEHFRFNQRAIHRISDIVESNALSRVQSAEQTLDDFNQSEQQGVDADIIRSRFEANLQGAREDFAQARELRGRSDEPKIQSWFLGAMHRASEQLSTVASPDTEAFDRAQIFSGILDHPYKQEEQAGWPAMAHGKGPLAQRFNGLLERNLHLTDTQSGKAKAFAMNRILELSFRGTLTEERLEMFGVSPEFAEALDPASLLVYTHPRLVGEMGDVLATNQGRKFVAENSKGPLPIKTFNEKVEEWKLENGASVVDDLLSGGISPLQQLRLELDTSVRQGADALKDEIDKTLEGLGAYAMTYSAKAGDAIGKAQDFYGAMLEEEDSEAVASLRDLPSAKTGELLAASSNLAIAGVASFAAERMSVAMEEGEDDAKLATGDMNSLWNHSNKWLGDINQLTKQVTDGDRVRLGLTKEASERVFNTGGNSLRQASMILADEIGAIAIERYAPLGFHPSTIRMAFREIRSEEFGKRLDESILRGVTEEEFEVYALTVSRLREQNGGGAVGLAKTWKETLGLAAMQLGRDVRGTTQLAMEEPDDLANLIGVGAATGWIGNQALLGLKTQTITRIARMQTMHRARLVFRQALRNSPDAVDSARRITTLMQQKSKAALRKAQNLTPDADNITGLEQRAAIMESATDALDYISNIRELTLEATPDFKNQRLLKWHDGQLRKESRKAAEIMRHVDMREMDEVFDELGLDGTTRNWIKNAGLFSTLRETANDVFNFKAGNKKVPVVLSGEATLLDTIVSDPSLKVQDLPISPEVMNGRNMSFLMRLFPGKRREFLQARYQQEALQWMSKYQDATVIRRGMGAENRAHLEAFTQFARTVEANRLRRIAVMKAVAEGTADTPRLEALRELRAASLSRVQKMRALRQELLDSGTPLDKTRLRDAPLFDEYTPEQMIQFIGVREGRHKIYDTLRNTFESEKNFWERVSDMGKRFDVESEGATADAARLKRRIISEFFEQPGLEDSVRVDLLEGHISPTKLRRNIRERKDLGRAFLRDELEELRESLDDPSIVDDLLDKYDEELDDLANGRTSAVLEGRFTTRKNLKSEWEEINRRAKTERANRFNVVEGISGAAEWGLMANISQRIGDGRTRSIMADSRALGLQQRLLVRAWTKKVDNLQRLMQRLTPDEQKLFNAAALIARDEGITAPLAALRKRLPDYFREIAPETDDIAVQHLWDNTDNFRKSLLKDMRDVNLIDAKQYDKLIGPYAPRLFSSTMLPKIYGTDGVDISLKPSKIRGVSIGELSAQRHISKVKAQVYPAGGRPITQFFDNVGEAESWIKRNYGISGERELVEEAGGEIGNTAQGSKFAILRPLGKEAQELGADFIQPGPGMFIQMRNLIEDMAQIRYFDSFDRKGVAFTPEEFRSFARANPRQAKKYKRMAESKRLGALSGKHVHRSVVRQMDHYSEISNINKSIQDAVESEAFIMAGDIGSLIDAAPGVITKLNAWQKAGITYNMIARNPATMVGNFLSDSLFFTRMAAGSEINLTFKGWKMAIDSYKTIRGLRSGKISINDLDDDLRRGMELGIIDESIFEAAGLQSERRILDIEATYGQKKSPMEAFIAPLRDDNIRKTMLREREVDNLLSSGDLSPRKEVRLLREKFALQKITESNLGTIAKLMARGSNILDGLVGKHRGRTSDIEGFSARFYGDLGNTNRLRAYTWLVKEKGLTPEAAAARVNRFMQTYSRIGTSAVGRQIQRFGKSTLGSPIVSFPFELVRISANIIRHNPAGMMAMMGTSLARNLMGMAASGMDPYESLDFMVSQPGGVLNLLGNQFIGLPNQQGLIVGNPALNIYGQIFNGYGVVNGLADAWDDAGDQTPLSTTMRMGTVLTSNFAFTSPLLNFGLSTMAKRDSLTGDIQRDGYRLMGDNLRRFMQPMLHPYTPRIGSFSEKLLRTRDGFKHAYSGREHSLFNRMFELGGIKVRGDVAAFLNALPASLGDPAKDAALRGTKAVAWMALWEDVPDDKIFGTEKGLGIEDYFALVVASSSYMDPQNGHDMAGANELALTDLRRAVVMLDNEDSAVKQRGAALFEAAKEDLIRLRTTRKDADATGLGFEAGREATAREVRGIVTRMLQLGQGYDEALEGFSVLRRTSIVARMAITRGAPEEMMDNLTRQFLLTRSGGLRGPANADELEQSISLIEHTLRTRADLNETNRDRLTLMGQVLEVWLAGAEAREFIENETVEKYIKAGALQDEVKELLK